MRVAFFEDALAGGFTPIALMRPVFELLCGQFSLRERVVRRFGVGEWGAFLRGGLAEVYREEHPQARVNDPLWLGREPTLLINGRWLPALEDLADVQPDAVGVSEGRIAYLTLAAEEAPLLGEVSGGDPWRTPPASETARETPAEPGGAGCELGTFSNWEDVLARLASSRRPIEVKGPLAEHPWDLVDHNAFQLAADFRLRQYGFSQVELDPRVAILGSTEDVYIDRRAVIDPFVVIDARGGPVSIEAGARIGAFTRLEGPCHVAAGSQLFRANVREATTIGPVCRVGGEVEASILHGYVNKYHDGFLGHSYVCPWVNLGALSTNSDLKNDYSVVRVPLAGEPIETGTNKAGCYIGDHTKTAIGSLFNTGTSIGVMCMVLPAGELPPKHIPSFTRLWHGVIDSDVDLDSAIMTARTAMSRRDRELTPAQERLLQRLHRETAGQRETAAKRSHRRKAARQISPLAGTHLSQ